ncbi:DUF1993 family protein [Pseudoponticoccus marisrubri]|uniref:DUF1993 domain-containing protein n=1 Tax=Pseudoponticoccus marisrubri TaxID=1685382 RepID=A0A0W7WI33_9RHOB|nr:DUF1993 family protein [Pseudoponticoccus marisrubri]KUF10201.1 hypothetical protein AVJ23_14260 [Pseudoponticoccus marisrubri]
MTPPLYTASVPVFLHYLDRARILVHACHGRPDLLEARLAPDMFHAAQQFASAAGFSLRGTLPLVGQPVPEFPAAAMDHEGLMGRLRFARDTLDALDPADFEGAEIREIPHRAGFAELIQSGSDYLHLFAMPNFMFHLSMGFAVLRQGGLDIGKSDFDALHDYPPGFRF